MAVWLESPPSHARKAAGYAAIREHLNALRDRNAGWETFKPEDRSWQDVKLFVPLESMLGARNQLDEFDAFFRRAFEDLLASGVADALAKAYDQS
jgi:hypothetical protein